MTSLTSKEGRGAVLPDGGCVLVVKPGHADIHILARLATRVLAPRRVRRGSLARGGHMCVER
jgi:hypothetical protein